MIGRIRGSRPGRRAAGTRIATAMDQRRQEWSSAGTSYCRRTEAACVLDSYDNVFIGLKLARDGPADKVAVFTQTGDWNTATTTYSRSGVNIGDTDWQSLILGLVTGNNVDYSDRFVLGSDEKPGPCDAALSANPSPCYPNDDNKMMKTLWQNLRDTRLFSDPQRVKTTITNPRDLYQF